VFVLPALITFISSFIAALIFTPIAIRLGIYLSIADIPGGRRKHARVTSRLGAVPLYIAFVIGIGIAQSFHLASNDQPNESWRLFGMLIGATIITGVGLLDDKIQLAARWQLVAQIICAVIAMLCLIFIQEFRSPFVNSPVVVFPVMVVILTMLWFVGMINTVNLLDGVDGLASTVALIAGVVTTIHMIREGQLSVALQPIALCGALIGFLMFNLPPARIFLGGGSLFLGFTLACIGIIAGAKVALLLLVLGMPIADVAWQIIDRARHGRNPASSDRGHLHLRMIDAGWSAKRVVFIYASVGIIFGGLALIVQPALFKLIAFGVLSVGVILMLLRFSQRAGDAYSATPDTSTK